MSLMAGFDVVIELSRGKLLQLIEAKMQLGGKSLSPPFILPVMLNPSGSDRINVKVTTLDLSLRPGTNMVGLIAQFQGTSVSVGGVTVTGLSGSTTVYMPLILQSVSNPTIVPGASQYKSLTLDVSSNSSVVLFEHDSQTALTDHLGGDIDTLQALAGQKVHDLVAANPPQPFADLYAIAPGQEGSLPRRDTSMPGAPPIPMIYERLDRVLAITDQVIALFGILLPSNDANGNVADKTTSALDLGHDVCVSLGPAAFRRLLFCPTIAKRFAKERMGGPNSPVYKSFAADPIQVRAFIDAQLTGCCGTAAGIDTKGVTITRLCDTLAAGHVNVEMDLTKSGFCYSAEGSGHSEIYFSFSAPNSLVATETQPVITSLDVDVDFWCKALVIVTGGELGSLAWGGIAAALSDSFAEAIGGTQVDPLHPEKPITNDLSGFADAQFNAVQLSPEGFTVQATLDVPVPVPSPLPTLELVGDIKGFGETYLCTAGIYHYPGSKECQARDFEYEVHTQRQQAVYSAVATDFGPPLTLEWSLEHHRGYYSVYNQVQATDAVTLSGPGPWSIKVDLSFPAPPLQDTLIRDMSISPAISIDGNTFTLTTPKPYLWYGHWDPPLEGWNYTLYLTIRATDDSGLTLVAQQPISLSSCWRDMDVAFWPYMHFCHLLAMIDIAHMKTKPQSVPRGGDPGRLEEIVGLILQGGPEVDGLLAAAEAVYGREFRQVLQGALTGPPASRR